MYYAKIESGLLGLAYWFWDWLMAFVVGPSARHVSVVFLGVWPCQDTFPLVFLGAYIHKIGKFI
jgi:hypothetical protein